MELQGRLKNIERDGRGLAAISYDPVSVLADFTRRRGITFPLLSDEGSATIKAFGILNTTVAPTNTAQYGIPFPGTFFLSRDAVVTSRVFEKAYQERDTISSMTVRLGGQIVAPATKIAAPHLDVTTYTTDQTVAPGTHFSLVFDLKAARGVHVYAPGVSGYRPVTVRLAPQPGLVVRDAHYPASVDYFFKPLNEHVNVFAGAFRIIQDVAIDASRESEAMLKERAAFTIQGSLDYQACDDRICFTPQSVPVSWTVSLKALDRERRQ